MSVYKRLSEVFSDSPEISFDETSKFIIFSDCHRGDNSWADDFSHNQQIFFHALRTYYKEGYTYIELGDGDELWENKNFESIRRQYSHIFWMMRKFYLDGRLLLVLGNHDMCKQNSDILSSYYDERSRGIKPLFPEIELMEGLSLKNKRKKIFLVHGHQGDLCSDRLWKFSQFWVRNCWKKLQVFGMKYPATPARNYRTRHKLELQVKKWIEQKAQPLIMGHTHRPSFPSKDDLPYYNSGSCVHPRCITGIEITNLQIALIKWSIEVDPDGKLEIRKSLLAGPGDL